MKNFTRATTRAGHYTRLRLIDGSGEFVPEFDAFTASMIDCQYAPLTTMRYSNAVAQFVDYLFEVGVRSKPSSRTEFQDAVNSYLPARCAPPETTGKHAPVHYQLVRELKLQQLTRVSARNTSAAINLFLQVLEKQALFEQQVAEWKGNAPDPMKSLDSTLTASSTQERSPTEFRHLAQNSTLANLIRAGVPRVKLSRSKVIAPKARKQRPEDADLPVEHVIPVLNAATSYRDRAVWAIMAGAGLRQSEAAQLLWQDINCLTQQVYVYDPYGRRLADQLPADIALRFKGRATSETYILPQLRDVFFVSLANYIRYEHRPVASDRMVFQDITRSGSGRPYCLVSDKSRVLAFKRACARANVPERLNHQQYTPHSLRHFYGVFMLNYVPVDGGYGLSLAEVQHLMGHMDPRQTAKYARSDKLILETKLRLLDEFAMGIETDHNDLREWLAQRHRSIAERLSGAIDKER